MSAGRPISGRGNLSLVIPVTPSKMAAITQSTGFPSLIIIGTKRYWYAPWCGLVSGDFPHRLDAPGFPRRR